MDQQTKAGIDQQEQTVDAANLASAMNGEEEENVTAKEKTISSTIPIFP
ncbi:hypothetical protein PM3016_2618 [Paenibacillus mucilaginosus 3016]|uniref:Uncharacterized protein n=2 Tax=Paenibacillus mucilaginosus TaxID=61624 RepID=H6NF91_9BACL|nr:hypothetical protein [Paenibacillus mucilaginosus]AFC29500.1 hypothetical protein PM3016_2618 [Paenibacillus mucilaginosus 3016]AFH61678.1 hypothetical protein B2K_13280 [Paenibacillus mucilaginosus K02]